MPAAGSGCHTLLGRVLMEQGKVAVAELHLRDAERKSRKLFDDKLH